MWRCRRCDEEHFRFYTNLPENLDDAIALVKHRYMKRTDAELHLTISHYKRRKINDEMQDKLIYKKAYIQIEAYENEHEYKICEGTPLIGCSTCKHIINGAFYQVIEIHDSIKIRDTLTQEIIDCAPETIQKNCQLGHAVVYNKVQGLTVKDKKFVYTI